VSFRSGVGQEWGMFFVGQIVIDESVWVFVGAKDYMRKEQQETVTSAKRFDVDVVETLWMGADHGGIFSNAMSYQRMLDWLVTTKDLRLAGNVGE